MLFFLPFQGSRAALFCGLSTVPPRAGCPLRIPGAQVGHSGDLLPIDAPIIPRHTGINSVVERLAAVSPIPPGAGRKEEALPPVIQKKEHSLFSSILKLEVRKIRMNQI